MEDWLNILIVIVASVLFMWVVIALAVSKNRHKRVREDLEVEQEKVKAATTELERIRNSLTPEIVVGIVHEGEQRGHKNPNAVLFGIVKAAAAAKLNTGALAVGMKGYSEELKRRVAEMEETLKLNENAMTEQMAELMGEKIRLEEKFSKAEKRQHKFREASKNEIEAFQNSSARSGEYSAIIHQLLEYKDHED